MDSNEVKKKMREALVRELTPQERTIPYVPTPNGVLTADQVMEEVEQDTELGKRVLNDFTVFYETGEWPLEDSDLTQIASLMETDINDRQTAEFGDTPIIVSDIGDVRTPRQLIQEIRDRTVLGMEFARTWADRNLVRVDLPSEDEIDPLQVN